ncbi:MAG: hypothetical protein ACYSWS_01205 [Planctomycetota bacterium]|jgi:hypothetical protein
MIDLKAQYVKKYKLLMEEAWNAEDSQANPDKVKDKLWYYEIRGKYGVIYLYGTDKLAVRITGNRIKSRIKTEYTDILSLYLEAEDVSIFLFNPENFEIVAKFIKAKRKRQITEEQRLLIIERTKKYRFQRSKIADKGLNFYVNALSGG